MAQIERFLSEHKFPLVEGRTTTFVFLGHADRVSLAHWIHGLPSTLEFRRIEGSDLWFLSLELPPESRVEYKFRVDLRGQAQLIRDPLNPHQAHDPFGANSVCHTTGYQIPDWTKTDPRTRPGGIEEHSLFSTALGGDRRYFLYLPARFRKTRTYPLLVVHDGADYLRFSSLQNVLDNLIHRHEIPPLIVAMTDPGERLLEYADHEPHARYLVEELVPHLEMRYPLSMNPAMRGIMGASFGAVASLSTAHRYPGKFGRLLLQSGSFAFTDIGEHDRGPVFDPVVRFMNRFRNQPERISERVFMSCGVYERLIYENRSLVPILQETGMKLRYVEAKDGHNWENWRDRLREGLSWLFPGPLWMVYE